jgi:hypothetical protein
MVAGGIRKLPGLDQLQPAQQGQLDRFCGIYAIINAIELALYPAHRLMPAQRKQLYDHGIGVLAEAKRLEGVALDGMNERLWIKLRDALVRAVGGSGAPKLQISSLPQPHAEIGLHELLRWIQRHIDEGCPVMLPLWGVYDHFTVVAGITSTKLLLFDSLGFQHVALSSLAIRTPRATARHRITRRSVSSLAVV